MDAAGITSFQLHKAGAFKGDRPRLDVADAGSGQLAPGADGEGRVAPGGVGGVCARCCQAR